MSLQANFGYAISGAGASFGTVAGNIIDELTVENFVDFATTHVGGFGSVTSPIMVLFCIILMAYAVIKVFFANLKRGGILLIQIAVGSLYMFSVPRGYLDGFYQWCKQVVGLCLTAFLQATILIAGLSLFNEHALLGLGLMLSAGEIPRIAGAFGLDTSTTSESVQRSLHRADGDQHYKNRRKGGCGMTEVMSMDTSFLDEDSGHDRGAGSSGTFHERQNPARRPCRRDSMRMISMKVAIRAISATLRRS